MPLKTEQLLPKRTEVRVFFCISAAISKKIRAPWQSCAKAHGQRCLYSLIQTAFLRPNANSLPVTSKTIRALFVKRVSASILPLSGCSLHGDKKQSAPPCLAVGDPLSFLTIRPRQYRAVQLCSARRHCIAPFPQPEILPGNGASNRSIRMKKRMSSKMEKFFRRRKKSGKPCDCRLRYRKAKTGGKFFKKLLLSTRFSCQFYACRLHLHFSLIYDKISSILIGVCATVI